MSSIYLGFLINYSIEVTRYPVNTVIVLRKGNRVSASKQAI